MDTPKEFSWVNTMKVVNKSASDQPQHLNTKLLKKLSAVVDGNAATATFACGGSIYVNDESARYRLSSDNSYTPFSIRWDGRSHEICKISYPLPEDKDESNEMFQGLISHCQPATFGHAGRDAPDEDYRKAVQLDASDFSTNLHPYDCGIMDSIQRILLAGRAGSEQDGIIGLDSGLQAQLYKLNVGI